MGWAPRSRHLLAALLMTACTANTLPPMRSPDAGDALSSPTAIAPDRPPQRDESGAIQESSVGFSRTGVPATMTGAESTDPEATGQIVIPEGRLALSEMLAVVLEGALGRRVEMIDPLTPDPVVEIPPGISIQSALERMRATLERQGYRLSFTPDAAYVYRRGSADRVPAGSAELVSLIQLNFIDANSFIRLASSFIPDTYLLAVPGSPSLAIYAGPREGSDAIQEIAELLDIFELRNTTAQVIPVRKASAIQVAGLVRQVLGPDNDFPRIIPFEAGNAVVVVAPRNFNVSDVRVLIRTFDRAAPDDNSPVFVFEPRFRPATELMDTLEALMRPSIQQAMAATEPRQQAPAGGGGGNSAPYAEFDALMSDVRRDFGLEASTGTAAAAQPPANDQTAQSAGGSAGDPNQAVAELTSALDGLSSLGGDDGPPARPGLAEILVATTADRKNNQIIYTGTQAQFDVLERALRTLDTPRGQILVEAAILQVALTDALEFGLQYSFEGDNFLGFDITGSLTSFGTLQTALPGLVVDLGRGGVRSIINALDEVTQVKVISAPKLLVASGDLATLRFGSSVPTLTRQLQTAENSDFVVSNEIVYRDVGITLSIRPQNIGDRLAEFEISEEISDVSEARIEGISSPIINERRIETVAKVRYGETIVLGGLIEERRTDSEAGIPGLRTLPLIGPFFGSQERSDQRSEFVLLLTPRLYFEDRTGPGISDMPSLRFDEALRLWTESASGDMRDNYMERFRDSFRLDELDPPSGEDQTSGSGV